MDNQRIIIDGPKQAVLDELKKNEQAKNPPAQSPNSKSIVKPIITKTLTDA